MPIELDETAPLLRIFDVAEARELHPGFLGFAIDREQRFDESLAS